jgi:hypothetical protein
LVLEFPYRGDADLPPGNALLFPGGAYHQDVGMDARGDSLALVARPAGSIFGAGAVHPLGDVEGQGALADMGRADYQVGMGGAAIAKGAVQLPNQPIMTPQLPRH